MARLNKDDALDYVCGGIVSKRVRNEVRQEMLDHFEDNFERNMAVGMTEEEAERAALDSFGRLSVLRDRITKLHSKNPLVNMDSALGLIFWGFILTSINFSGFPYVSEVTDFVCAPLILFALFRMRKTNGNLRKAFYAQAAVLFLSTAYECVLRAFNSVTAINAVFIILIILSGIIFYCYLLTGLQNLYKTYAPDNENRKVNFTLSIISYTLFSIFIGYVLLSSSNLTTTNITVSGALGYMLIPFMLLVMVYTAVQIRRVRKTLWDADEEYNIEGYTKRNSRIMTCIIAILVIMPICAMYIGANPPVKYQELVINDISDTTLSKKADVIREQMISLGLPEEIADDLPDSEIIKYDGAEKMETDINTRDTPYQKALGFCFFIPQEEENRTNIRILTCIKPTESKSCDALFINFLTSTSKYLLTTEDKPFTQNVYTDIDKKLSGGIVNTKNMDDAMYSNLRAIEFNKNSNFQNQHLYYAETFVINDRDADHLYLNTYYIHRKTWFGYNRSDILNDFSIMSGTKKNTEETSQILFEFENLFCVYEEKATVTEQIGGQQHEN